MASVFLVISLAISCVWDVIFGIGLEGLVWNGANADTCDDARISKSDEKIFMIDVFDDG